MLYALSFLSTYMVVSDGLGLVKFVTALSVHRITKQNIAAIRHRRMLRKRGKTSCLIRTGCERNFMLYHVLVDDVSSIITDSF
jgi:hypothetical protein